MAQTYNWPTGLSINPSVGLDGGVAPSSSTQIAGQTTGGTLVPVSVDASGNQNVNVVSSVLPTGASTSALQVSGNSTLTTISSQLPTTLGTHVTAASLAVNIASDQTVPISAVALPLPTGASTSALQTSGNTTLTAISGQLPTTIGAHVTAASLAVSIASDQTVPVSAASLPLPTGAATSAGQTTGNTSLATIATNTAGLAQGSTTSGQTGPLMQAEALASTPTYTAGTTNPLVMTLAGGLRTDSSAVTQPVSAASLPLPSGASTSALQTSGNTSLASIATNTTGIATSALQTSGNATLSTISGQLPATLGQKASSASASVVIASDQTAISTAMSGKAVANAPIYNSYVTTNVTTSAFVQLVASTTLAANMIEIFDSSGQAMIIGVGASGSEVVQLYTLPGGNGQTPLKIPAGSRVAIKALTASATSGYLIINFYT